MKNFSLIISEKAEIQIEQAIFYYDLLSKRVADNFIVELQICFNSIEKNPEMYQIIKNNFRQAPLKKFPYVVIYSIEKLQKVLVLSIFHTSRNPKMKFK
jgi:plasmid stabilization system protein ParE